MNILITGHKGFIGSNLVKRLSNPNKLYEWFSFKPRFCLKKGLTKLLFL